MGIRQHRPVLFIALILALAGALAAGCSSSPAHNGEGSKSSTTTSTTSTTSTTTTTTTHPSSTGTTSSTPGQASHAVVPAPGSNGRPYWLLGEYTVGPLLHSGLSTTLLQDFFNNPQTFLIINGGTSAKATVDPRLPDATYVLKFASYQEMQSAVAAGTIPSSIKFLAYDNEHWTATPKVEQQNPYAFEAEAEQLAHAHGFGFIFTPAANLSMDLSRSYTNATKYTGYVNLGIASHGAPYADIFEIQGQQDEALSGFSSFVSTAVGQAKAANPHAVILLGLTTKAPGQNVTTQLLMADYDFSRSEVAGYWLNIPGGHGAGLQSTQVAVTFLQSLAPQLGY